MNRNRFKWLAPFIFIMIIGCFYVVVTQSIPLAGYFFGISPKDAKEALDIAGQFGDSSGFINALFSALAFGGVLLTFYWQFMVDGKQHKATLQSQFENVFFNMTNTLEKIVDGLSVIPTEVTDVQPSLTDGNGPHADSPATLGYKQHPTICGRQVFKYWFEYFRSLSSDADNKIEVFKELMTGSLDHYFRYLYRILVYIDQSELIDDKDKYEYAAILRAQLSEYELLIIFFNGLSVYGKQKAKPLFEKYSLFNNLRDTELEQMGGLAQFKQGENELPSNTKYSPQAFDHSYNCESHCGRFFCRLVLIIIAAISGYELIRGFWNEYVINLILSKVPNNIWIEIICILIVIAVYSTRILYKRQFNRQLLTKIYGNQNSNKYLSFSKLLDAEYNTIALTVLALLIYASLSKGEVTWSWSGSPVPYVCLLSLCSLADIIASAIYVKWVGLTRESFLDWISTVIIPGSASLRRWWARMKQRYERQKIDNQSSNSTNISYISAVSHTDESSVKMVNSEPSASELQTPVSNDEAPEDIETV